MVPAWTDRRAGVDARFAAASRRCLYGSRAELSFATRAPRGSSAKIVIDDPGSL